MNCIAIGLIGDRNDAVIAHRAIPRALDLAASRAGVRVEPRWLPTESLAHDLAPAAACDALWCVPASPYRSTDGALAAIRHARETSTPFLGTCGGFQHALLEYARNALGLADAAHAELVPDAGFALVAPLACALVEQRGRIRLVPGTRLAALYGRTEIEEGYHCSYGLAPEHRVRLEGGPLRWSGFDDAGEVRAFELEGHPFFVGTLFQPERVALEGNLPPLAEALIAAVTRA